MEKIRQKTHDALRWSEKFTKTDMVYLTKGSFWLFMVQAASILSSLALSVIFARYFPKDAYGNYRYAITLLGIIGVFSLTGIGTAITQSVSRGFDGALKQGYIVSLKWSVGTIAISLLAALYYWVNNNHFLALSLVAIALINPFLSSTSIYNSFLSGKRDFKTIGWLSIVRNFIPALILIIIIFTTTNPLVMTISYFAAHTLASAVCYVITKYKYKPQGPADPNMASYSKHLSLLTVLNGLADQIDKVVIFHYVGAVQLAVYSFAIALPSQIKSVFKSIPQLAFPKYANQDIHYIRKEITQKMLTTFIVCVIIAGLYILAAPLIYKILFPEYLDSIKYSQVFAISLLGFMSTFPSTAMQAKKNIKALYYSNMLNAVAKIVILFGLAYLYGVWGVVIARVLFEFVGVAIAWSIFERVAKNQTLPDKAVSSPWP